MTQQPDNFINPENFVKLPSGRGIGLQQQPFAMWFKLNGIFANLLVSMSTEGEMSEQLLRERMPTTLMEGFSQERQLYPDKPSTVGEFLMAFSPDLTDEVLSILDEQDLTAAWIAILEHNPRFFEYRRPAVLVEVQAALQKLDAVTEEMMAFLNSRNPASDSTTSDSIPETADSPSNTRSRSSKRRRNSTSAPTPALQ